MLLHGMFTGLDYEEVIGDLQPHTLYDLLGEPRPDEDDEEEGEGDGGDAEAAG